MLSLLPACDDPSAGGGAVECAGPTGPLALDQTSFDPYTCTACTCAPGGALNCVAIPDCVPPDAGRPDAAPDRGIGGAQDGSPEPCTAAENHCLDDRRAQRCLPSGVLTTLECGPQTRCVVDRCAPPACDPGALFCLRGRRLRCGPDGYTFTDDVPCDPGLICADAGLCVDPQADVLMVVDTSSSMSRPVQDGEPQPFPLCEDPQAPYTRLGLVKVALQALFATEQAQALRLALQRFPQRTTPVAVCGPGHYEEDQLDLEAGEYRISAPEFAALRDRVLAVPFSMGGATPIDALLRWIDFDERWGVWAEDCAGCEGVCVNGACEGHLDPELRASGETPLGRSLFLAGEYFRHEILREGKVCAADADCGSPHYTCVDGACHDPLFDCRPYVVLLFTDGAENIDAEGSYFHPVTQARRLNVGLDCADDDDCFAPSRCEEGTCVVGRCETDEGKACQLDADCDGSACLHQAAPAERYPGALRITHPGGRPAQLTVHVVDAVGGRVANRAAAFWGGGRYQRVQTLDVGALLSALQPLLDAKGLLDRCLAQR